ncbi:hypothetical protein MBLNU230_g3973t1 [Neophaeotheca triangularis]
MNRLLLTACLSCLVSSSTAQNLLQSQNSTWNSSLTLTDAQIRSANLSAATVQNVETAINYERTNQPGGPIENDHFYDLPDTYDPTNPPPPGTILKIEQHTNTTLYTLPPTLSMSRILYTTSTLNGTTIPASAYILWPYLPRHFPHLSTRNPSSDTNTTTPYPLIAYAHGTSGHNRACAPSHLRSLWDSAPLTLALSGYAVVAPDYAGLGIANTTSPYFVLPAQASDLLHSVSAAQSAWQQELSTEFVVMGHSQGGGTAWAAAERVARAKEGMQPGFLGTVAAAPFLDVLDAVALQDGPQVNGRMAAVASGLGSVFEGFELEDWLTEAGVARLRLLAELGGCNAVSGALFSAEGGEVGILKEGWERTEAARWFNSVASNGGKPVAGPMLVIQGTEDGNAILNVTTDGVRRTCEAYPESELEYVVFEGLGHVPVLYGGQHVWLDWVADRFRGVAAGKCCSKETVSPPRGVENIVPGRNWFISYNVYGI